MEKLERKIVKFIGDAAPNNITERIVILHFQSEYLPHAIVNAIQNLERGSTIVSKSSDSNLYSLFPKYFIAGEEKTKSYYLKDYTGYQEVKDEIQVGEEKYPRMIAGDVVRPEDINFVIEQLAISTKKAKENTLKEIKENSRQLNTQLIVIFGIFVSIFAVIVIGTDKLITLDPSLIKELAWWQLIGKSSALLAPVLIVVCVLVLMLDWVRKK